MTSRKVYGICLVVGVVLGVFLTVRIGEAAVASAQGPEHHAGCEQAHVPGPDEPASGSLHTCGNPTSLLVVVGSLLGGGAGLATGSLIERARRRSTREPTP